MPGSAISAVLTGILDAAGPLCAWASSLASVSSPDRSPASRTALRRAASRCSWVSAGGTGFGHAALSAPVAGTPVIAAWAPPGSPGCGDDPSGQAPLAPAGVPPGQHLRRGTGPLARSEPGGVPAMTLAMRAGASGRGAPAPGRDHRRPRLLTFAAPVRVIQAQAWFRRRLCGSFRPTALPRCVMSWPMKPSQRMAVVGAGASVCGVPLLQGVLGRLEEGCLQHL